MKILILGISGRTGKLAAEEAIKRGHKVVGIARNPGKVDVEKAEIFAGTPTDLDTVRKALTGCDAVISALSLFPQSQSFYGKVKTPLHILSESMKNVVKAMEEKGVKRVVLMTAHGAGDSAKELPWFLPVIIRFSILRYSFADHNLQEKALEDSKLDWTIVRPVGLSDNKDNLSILTRVNGTGKLKPMIGRNAVAHFMLDCIEKGQYIREKPGISNG